MIKYERHVLQNGLRVFLAPMKETQAVTILFLFGVGSRYEADKENGLSHFLEHMMFKGTQKRPTTLDISQELDSLGAEYNAYTGEERTGYYVSAAAEDFPIAFDVITDMLYNSTFSDEEIEKEKGVICEEIKMYHDNPTSYLDEISGQLVFGDTPLGRDVAGTAETVKSFQRDHFVEYKQRFYGPENTIVAITGNPAKHDWLNYIEGTLAHLTPGQLSQFAKQEELRGKPTVTIGHRPIDQAHLSLTHYAFPFVDERNETLDVLSNILGGTMSSRLFIEVRERRGLAYYVNSGISNFRDIGTLECSAGVDPTKLHDTITVMIEQINRLKNEPVSEEELLRAKRNIKGRISLRLEDSHAIARYLVNEELFYNQVIQPEEYIAKIEKVTASDIMEIANQVFQVEGRKLAVVGPIEASRENELAKLLK